MREGILDQIPKELPERKNVILFGPSHDEPGCNTLRSLISELNRKGKQEWICSEFRDRADYSKISTDRTAIVLTMAGVSPGLLTNIRRAAHASGVCCPKQALTSSETKEILRVLSELRKDGLVPNQSNGNGYHHPAPGKGEGQRLEKLAKSAQETSHVFSGVLHQPEQASSEVAEPEVDEALLEEIVVDDPKEVAIAIAALQKFREISDETEVAVMMVGDLLKSTRAERDELQLRLETKDQEIAQLRTQLESIQKIEEEKTALLEENKRLETKVRKLDTTLDQFKSLIDRAGK